MITKHLRLWAGNREVINLKRRECFYKWNKLTSRSTLTWARALKHLSPQPTKRNRIVALLWALLCSSGMLCRCFYSVCSLLVSSIILTQEVTLKQCVWADSHLKISAFSGGAVSYRSHQYCSDCYRSRDNLASGSQSSRWNRAMLDHSWSGDCITGDRHFHTYVWTRTSQHASHLCAVGLPAAAI